MFLQKNLIFLFENRNKKDFCENCGIPYRTFQDAYLGITKDPRISLILAISEGLNISIDDLIKKDLSEANICNTCKNSN